MIGKPIDLAKVRELDNRLQEVVKKNSELCGESSEANVEQWAHELKQLLKPHNVETENEPCN